MCFLVILSDSSWCGCGCGSRSLMKYVFIYLIDVVVRKCPNLLLNKCIDDLFDAFKFIILILKQIFKLNLIIKYMCNKIITINPLIDDYMNIIIYDKKYLLVFNLIPTQHHVEIKKK